MRKRKKKVPQCLRAAEWTDFVVDGIGVFTGSVCALAVFFVGLLIVKRTVRNLGAKR